MSEDPRSYNTPDLKALLPEQLDNLGRAVISLTRSLSLERGEYCENVRVAVDTWGVRGPILAGEIRRGPRSESVRAIV